MKAFPNGVIVLEIFGHKEVCKILAIHAFGTLDVERLSDGKCFRVTGMRGR